MIKSRLLLRRRWNGVNVNIVLYGLMILVVLKSDLSKTAELFIAMSEVHHVHGNSSERIDFLTKAATLYRKYGHMFRGV